CRGGTGGPRSWSDKGSCLPPVSPKTAVHARQGETARRQAYLFCPKPYRAVLPRRHRLICGLRVGGLDGQSALKYWEKLGNAAVSQLRFCGRTMEASKHAILTQGLTKRYDGDVLALAGVDLAVPANTIYA